MEYELITNEKGSTCIQRNNEDGSISLIPNDPANSDYQAYLRWVENPNAPEFQTPWVEPQLTK